MTISKVELISYTQSNRENRIPNNLKEYVAYVARVSNLESQMKGMRSDRLIKYLKDNKHWSPFEMAHITLYIESTRDIIRQILRHRSFTFQEFSQRYANPLDPKEQLGFVNREARLQDTKNRQNSFEVEDEPLQNMFLKLQEDVYNTAQKAYEVSLEHGIAKEQARVFLPEGLTKSRIFMTGSLRSWIHYIDLRTGNGTQKEHQEIALKAKKIIEDLLNE